MKRCLNLYAGVGGNAMLWENCEVTAVELDPKIADIYQRNRPNDIVISGVDAHQYLLDNYMNFEFIWSSRPCVSHSRMAISGKNKTPRYADLGLYEEILFLQQYCKDKKWIVENVVPYYEPLIAPTNRCGRHLYWANFDFYIADMPTPGNFIKMANTAGKEALQDWLQMPRYENVYAGNNHCPAQIYRNAVHPLVGKGILDQAFNEKQKELF